MLRFLEIIYSRVCRKFWIGTISGLTQPLGTLLRGLHSLINSPPCVPRSTGLSLLVSLTDTVKAFFCLYANVGTHSSVMTSLSILPVIRYYNNIYYV